VYEGARIAQVRAELKALEQLDSAEWQSLTEDVPYQKGSHPLKAYMALAYEMLKGELQLWNSVLPTHEEASLLVFVAICDAAVAEMQRLLSPFLLDDQKSKQTNSHINKQVLPKRRPRYYHSDYLYTDMISFPTQSFTSG
jgi:hypothetical protein